MNKQELREEFKKETGYNYINSQGEPDIDYMKWLEQKLVKLFDKTVDVDSDVCPDPTHHAVELGLMDKCSTCGATE